MYHAEEQMLRPDDVVRIAVNILRTKMETRRRKRSRTIVWQDSQLIRYVIGPIASVIGLIVLLHPRQIWIQLV